MHYLLDLEVRGERFAGTQRQQDRRTVQGVVERSLSLVAGAPTGVRPASRLDAGVDARHLPCDVRLERVWDLRALCHAVNRHLPPDCRVRRAAAVADGFNCQHRAVSKTYRYRCVLRGAAPVRDARRWWLTRPIDAAVLDRCAALIPGRQDLSAFSALRRDDSDGDDPVRSVLAAHWEHGCDDGDPVHDFVITGEGFLYKQVRALVGAMVCCAMGGAPEAVFAAACAGGRGGPRPGNIAPAEGLCLEAVRYDPEPAWGTA
jgi:tRNA pseudouridine38-40 synthase